MGRPRVLCCLAGAVNVTVKTSQLARPGAAAGTAKTLNAAPKAARARQGTRIGRNARLAAAGAAYALRQSLNGAIGLLGSAAGNALEALHYRPLQGAQIGVATANLPSASGRDAHDRATAQIRDLRTARKASKQRPRQHSRDSGLER